VTRLPVLLLIVALSACAQLQPQERYAEGSEMFDIPPSEPETAERSDLLWPGWRVEVVQLDEERFRLELRMRALITGGEGEVGQVFRRSAQRIVDDGGYAGYSVIRFEEGVDSGFLVGRRSARGEIRIIRSQMLGI
jgi:hypothetical protein